MTGESFAGAAHQSHEMNRKGDVLEVPEAAASWACRCNDPPPDTAFLPSLPSQSLKHLSKIRSHLSKSIRDRSSCNAAPAPNDPFNESTSDFRYGSNNARKSAFVRDRRVGIYVNGNNAGKTTYYQVSRAIVRGTYDKDQAETILHSPPDTISVPFESILLIYPFALNKCFFH